jgi:hypothetical protein
MFAQQTSLQVFPLAPVAIFGRNRIFSSKKTKK